MTDLYNIPNDNRKDYRLKKFVEYQHEVPSIHYRFLGEWIKKYNYDFDNAVNLCWYMSITYNEITCFIIDELFKAGKTPETIWKFYKPYLDFGSARKYAKNNDWFVPLIYEWKELTDNKPYIWLKTLLNGNDEENYKKLQDTLRKQKYVGRFASDLFIESVTYLKDYLNIEIKEPFSIDWKNCANLTSGIFNIFYEDEKANIFDKTGIIEKEDYLFLSNSLKIIQNEIKNTYPEQDNEVTMFIGKICSFRNLFKAARYGGFHHDRELGVIKKYEKDLPQFNYLYRKMYELRLEMFPNKFLGELNGWDGIRKERKKIWLKRGLTGVE